MKNKGSFLSNSLILMAGTALAQMIPLLMSPYLSRVYSPGEFGLFGLYFNAVSMLGVIVCLRYELCIVLPEKDEDSWQLVYLCLGLSIVSSLVIYALFWLGIRLAGPMFNYSAFEKYLWTIPVSVLFVGAYQAFNYYLTRGKAFRASALNRVMQKSGEGLGNLGFGQYQVAGGLVYADLMGRFLALITAAYQGLRLQIIIEKPNRIKILELMYRYKSFALNGTIPSFFNAVSLALPIYFMNWFYSTSDAGQFNLSRMVLAAPISIITVNIGQVLMQRLSEIKDDESAFRALFFNVLKILGALGCVLLIGLVLFSVPVFEWVFGNLWEEAGRMTIILSAGYVLRFIVAPLSVVFTVKEDVKTLAIWQIGYGICIGLLYFFRDQEVHTFLWVFTAIEVSALLVYFILILRTLYRKKINVSN